jgi:ectoine hydroxylase-related dioxygenase (phytanoyl-CoA dioxygenase family)
MRTWTEMQSLMFDPPRLGRAAVRRLQAPIRGLSALTEFVKLLAVEVVHWIWAPVRYVRDGAMDLKEYFAPEQQENLTPKSWVGPWIRLLRGAWIHARTGDTPRSAHVALMALFIKSGGRANDFLSRAIGLVHPPYRLPRASGVLGDLTGQDLKKIQRQLESDGYYVFENCLSAEFCESVIEQSLKLDCSVLGDEIVAQGTQVSSRYQRGAGAGACYSLGRDDTTDMAEVQRLISDPSIIAVAQNYLKAKPIFSAINLAWSVAVKDTPDRQAAQEFHWDMERIKWLRFFIYLTDVGPDNGPHCFIKGTHRADAIPDELRKRGYVRHSDETILSIYGRDAYKEFVGSRGTIVAEDSRGFHKGKMLTKGDRLLLAFEVSNTLFGANKRHHIRNIHVPQFGVFAKKYSRIYSNLDFEPGLLN